MPKVKKTFNSDGKRICNVLGCKTKHSGHGYCQSHLKRIRKTRYISKIKSVGSKGHFLHCRYYGMIQRCYNPKDPNYSRYGGRGIKVFADWLPENGGFWEYALWMQQNLGEIPPGKDSIDRIDNDGDYEPGNIRWADQTLQNHNTGMFSTNTSGVKGVSWRKDKMKWRATIVCHNKQIHLGSFSTIEEAAAARKAAELKYHKIAV